MHIYLILHIHINIPTRIHIRRTLSLALYIYIYIYIYRYTYSHTHTYYVLICAHLYVCICVYMHGLGSGMCGTSSNDNFRRKSFQAPYPCRPARCLSPDSWHRDLDSPADGSINFIIGYITFQDNICTYMHTKLKHHHHTESSHRQTMFMHLCS